MQVHITNQPLVSRNIIFRNYERLKPTRNARRMSSRSTRFLFFVILVAHKPTNARLHSTNASLRRALIYAGHAKAAWMPYNEADARANTHLHLLRAWTRACYTCLIDHTATLLDSRVCLIRPLVCLSLSIITFLTAFFHLD